MDILSLAISMEEEGAKFYRSLADAAKSKPFKAVLSMMAEDEDKHKKAFKAWKEKNPIDPEESQMIAKANSIFHEAGKEDFISAKMQLELYIKARDKEQEAVEHYLKLQEQPEYASNRELIGKIIEEERKHLALLTDLIEYISQPEQWVESAEFGVRSHY